MRLIFSFMISAEAYQTNIFRFVETRHSLEMSHSDGAHPRLFGRHKLVQTERHH